MTPLVSIIIPFYNCSYVQQAVESSINQTYPNVEVIVVDDGSYIHTEKLHPYMHRIRYIRKENGGTATALNAGIQAAQGEYIAWLSSDDFFLPDKIQKQMDFMLPRGAAFSFGNYHYINEYNQILVPWCGHRFSPNVQEVPQFFLQGNPVNGCTIVMKKTCFDHVGLFDPQWLYTHDYDMWFRLILAGYDLYYIDDVLIQFRTHGEAGTRKYQPQIMSEVYQLEAKYRPQLWNKLYNPS
ncbi:glycosyltransferase [Bacillus mangrovi]|uniref:Glycosyltransferase n=1 Tax=Metabacillus mangrovi TaxID=1491830 RepID=A0A7X2S1W1_9BACI|nr:glycosyltransferase [Metabacillus mangrovi]MTH52055.1 glycosyltransferase [Metabacillus mangrovi]